MKKRSVIFGSSCISITYSDFSGNPKHLWKGLLNCLFHYCWKTLLGMVYNKQKLLWNTVNRVRSCNHRNHKLFKSYIFV